ncbi:MAG: glycogen/starch synthase [Elusimicrobiota bacterium]|jgi:starch synthase
MKILQAASEAFPFCKTGGLADVIGALSQKLGAAGHDVLLFLPKYRAVEAAQLRGGIAYSLDIPFGSGSVQVWLRYMQWRSVSVQFIDCPTLFDRDGIYGKDGRDHADNDLRFAVFSRAVLEGAKAMGFKPDIVHLHDWQAALAAAYLKKQYGRDPFFAQSASVLTVHNIAYQGAFPARSMLQAGFSRSDLRSAALGAGSAARYSFLKAGLACADWLTTVSPTYAREVQGRDNGQGMETVMRRRRSRLRGIVNGIDLDYWNPARDAFLPQRYSFGDLAGKTACKKAFLAECRLRGGERLPLVGMVARLDPQKGWDLAMKAMAPHLRRCRMVAIGEGDPRLAAAVSKWAARHRGVVHFHCGYSEDLAHRVYAASDMLLMPSRFEPCGLGQMIAMRYACVPVVARTGGLMDTVREDGPDADGFTAESGDARDFSRAVGRALQAWAGPGWKDRVQAGLRRDSSWDASVRRYLELFERAVSDRRAQAASGARA